MSETAWYRSLYWRVGIGFVVFLIAVLALQAGATFVQSEFQIPHHHLSLLREVVRREYLAQGVGGDLASAEDQLIGPLRRYHV